MKVTVYTISDCQFSKQEKEYLKSKAITFEEKNLEQNKEFLTEMLAVSNNFAGTPVTKIEKDDGQISILKGFTKEEFDKVFESSPAQTVGVAAADTSTPIPTPPAGEPTEPTTPTPPAGGPTETPPPAAEVPPPTTPEPTLPPIGDVPAAPSIPAEPEKPVEPMVPPTPATPSEPVQTAPATPATPEPAAPAPTTPSATDPQLASILSDLQNMSGTQGAGQATTPSSSQPS